jgi:orotate phosphoribosyltransferase
MSKIAIYNELFEINAINVKEFIVSNEKPYNLYFNKILSNPDLFDKLTLLIETFIHTKNLQFDKICSTSISALPYATNVATSLNKGILYITNEGNDVEDKDNIKNLTIEGGMNIDERILLIESVTSNNFLINNIIKRIEKYGGIVSDVIIIIDQCEGEYINLSCQSFNIIPILNIYDIFNYMETNNKIDIFHTERVKFYCEKVTKMNIKKLLEGDKKEEVASEPVSEVASEPVSEVSKQIFVSQ